MRCKMQNRNPKNPKIYIGKISECVVIRLYNSTRFPYPYLYPYSTSPFSFLFPSLPFPYFIYIKFNPYYKNSSFFLLILSYPFLSLPILFYLLLTYLLPYFPIVYYFVIDTLVITSLIKEIPINTYNTIVKDKLGKCLVYYRPYAYL